MKKKLREVCLGVSFLVGVVDFGERISGGSDFVEVMGDSFVWIILLLIDVCGDLGMFVGGDFIFKVKDNGGVFWVDDSECGMFW